MYKVPCKSFLLQVSSCAFEVAEKILLWAVCSWDGTLHFPTALNQAAGGDASPAQQPPGKASAGSTDLSDSGHTLRDHTTAWGTREGTLILALPPPQLAGLICPSSSRQWLIFWKLENFTVN